MASGEGLAIVVQADRELERRDKEPAHPQSLKGRLLKMESELLWKGIYYALLAFYLLLIRDFYTVYEKIGNDQISFYEAVFERD